MFNNSSKIMFFSILITGTLIAISANSWMGAWMGLEINLLSFIPLMKDNKLMSTESSLKYFLTQALASSVFLFAVILFMLNSSKMNSNYFMENMSQNYSSWRYFSLFSGTPKNQCSKYEPNRTIFSYSPHMNIPHDIHMIRSWSSSMKNFSLKLRLWVWARPLFGSQPFFASLCMLLLKWFARSLKTLALMVL